METEIVVDDVQPETDDQRSPRSFRKTRRSARIDGKAATIFANATRLTLVSVDARGTIRFVKTAEDSSLPRNGSKRVSALCVSI